VMRDVFAIVPPILRESAYGLGCTTWEVVRYIVLPYTQKGVIGGIMLGLGRALGETMAVTFVIGNSQRISESLFAPGTSIASTLANEFGEADDFHLSTLFALGFLLFVITFIVLALAKIMILRTEKPKGPKHDESKHLSSSQVRQYARSVAVHVCHGPGIVRLALDFIYPF